MSGRRRPAGRVFDAQFDLLDRQVVGPGGELVCKVDDLELTQAGPGGPFHVSAILVGPAALGPRIGGPLGRFMVWLRRRWGEERDAKPLRLDWGTVSDVGSAVRVVLHPDQARVRPLEGWLRAHLIDHVPGARHADE